MPEQKPTGAMATLGTILPGPAGRDAIHVAVMVVQARDRLEPGEHATTRGESGYLRLRDDEDRHPWNPGERAVGIVDPFLRSPVEPGQWFWLLIYPRTITDLRHVWTHPQIPDASLEEKVAALVDTDKREAAAALVAEMRRQDKAAKDAADLMLVGPSKRWLEKYANRLDVSTDEMMHATKAHLTGGEYWYHPVDGGRFEGEDLPAEFWHHYEKVTGETVPEDKKHNFFSCAC